MTVRKLIRVTTFACALFYCAAVIAVGQAPAPSPKKPAPAVKTSAGKLPAAPQVVTIIHRINGLKMFRLLLRSEQQVQSVASLDWAFNLMDDVHTNVIAGLAMDDGETIAAWLPEAEVEFGPPDMIAPVAPPTPRVPKPPRAPRVGVFNNSPDITVIGPEGKRLAAKYVGLDAVTGLSILRLVNKNAVPAGATKDEPLNTGETVLLFSPEPVTKSRALLRGSLYARMGAIEGRIQDVMPAPSGGIARFKVSAPKLSHANIGGVALNEAGETIGIVDGLEGNEASILPAALIRRAAQRVLEQQASVPRPWLGVKGEAVTALNLDQIRNHGWALQRAEALADKHRGILLTSIVPDSPAAKAALRAGDVILKVDDNWIRSADDFTWWLEQAGPSSSVEFTVTRPDRPAEEPLNVKLSEKLDPMFSFSLRRPAVQGFSLFEQGIETIALKPPVASQLGTTAGLLVVYVEPLTAASEAGLQPGDVIQAIDGKPVSSFKPATQPTSFTFEIVRNKEKLVVVVPPKKK
ncbi:MAG TPA: PDZ domain-containing protein [Pyrinomonadaceae bacterium]|nr:PDZ domain-containing protein [Pyrinomonadaceae bacterium]